MKKSRGMKFFLVAPPLGFLTKIEFDPPCTARVFDSCTTIMTSSSLQNLFRNTHGRDLGTQKEGFEDMSILNLLTTELN